MFFPLELLLCVFCALQKSQGDNKSGHAEHRDEDKSRYHREYSQE